MRKEKTDAQELCPRLIAHEIFKLFDIETNPNVVTSSSLTGSGAGRLLPLSQNQIMLERERFESIEAIRPSIIKELKRDSRTSFLSLSTLPSFIFSKLKW